MRYYLLQYFRMKQKTKFALDYKEKLKTNISNLLEPLVLMI